LIKRFDSINRSEIIPSPLTEHSISFLNKITSAKKYDEQKLVQPFYGRFFQNLDMIEKTNINEQETEKRHRRRRCRLGAFGPCCCNCCCVCTVLVLALLLCGLAALFIALFAHKATTTTVTTTTSEFHY